MLDLLRPDIHTVYRGYPKDASRMMVQVAQSLPGYRDSSNIPEFGIRHSISRLLQIYEECLIFIGRIAHALVHSFVPDEVIDPFFADALIAVERTIAQDRGYVMPEAVKHV